MPCYATGSREGDAELSAREAQQEALEATRAACEMMAKLKENDLSGLSKQTRAWIKKHVEIDRKRMKEKDDAVKQSLAAARGLAKLTKQERKALGL